MYKKMLGHSIMWCLCLQHTPHPTNLQSTQHHLHSLHQNQLGITKVCLVCPISSHFVALSRSPSSSADLQIKQNQLVDIPINTASTTRQNTFSHSPIPLPSVYQRSTLCRPWSTLQLPWYTKAPFHVSLGFDVVVHLGGQQHPSPHSN